MNNPIKFYEYFDNKRQCRAVKATTTYAGKRVEGVSYVHPDDNFDLTRGKYLAKLRCEVKIAERRASRYKNKVNNLIKDKVALILTLKQLDEDIAYCQDISNRSLEEVDDLNKKIEEFLDI